MKQFVVIYALLAYVCILNGYAQSKKNSTDGNKTADGFSTTSTGLQYKIIKDSAGTDYPEVGGFITFWFEMRTSNDSIFDSQFSESNPNAVGIPTPIVKHKKSIEEGLFLLTQGDSALFILNADSLYEHSFSSEPPSFLPKGSAIQMIVKMGKVYSKLFVDSVRVAQKTISAAKAAAERKAYQRDSVEIQKYLTAHKLKGEAIEGGVYIVKRKSSPANSPYIVKGEIIETKYIGKLLIEGTEFDRSGEGLYFEFTVGLGEVIQGWDYAFQRLKSGEKALVLIPSGLAYGYEGVPGVIPPNAPLLFEVEIKK